MSEIDFDTLWNQARAEWSANDTGSFDNALMRVVYEAGRKAERERLRDQMFAQACRYPFKDENLIWNAFNQACAEADKAEPVAPPAATEQPKRCAARASGTPGGIDAAECDWPWCGCDPHASKVIAALEEQGALKEQPQPEPARASTLEERAQKLADWALEFYTVHRTGLSERIAQLCRDFAREALRHVVKSRGGQVYMSGECEIGPDSNPLRKFFYEAYPTWRAHTGEDVAAKVIDLILAAAEHQGEVPR